MPRVKWLVLALLIGALGLAWRSAHGQFETPPARETVVGFDVAVKSDGDAFFSVLVQDGTGKLHVDVYNGEGTKTGQIPLVSPPPEASTVHPMP